MPTSIKLFAVLILFAIAPSAFAVDFTREIQPLLESACLHCHNEQSAEGGLRLDTKAFAFQGGDSGAAIVAGKPTKSPLYSLTVLSFDDGEIMPPDEAPLTESQTKLLHDWIADGADWPDDATLKTQPRINFATHIRPVLEQNCLSCHRSENSEGGLDLSTAKMALAGGDSGAVVIPFEPSKSLIYTTTMLAKDDDQLMPPTNAGGPLPKNISDRFKLWIEQGAIWPDGPALRPQPKQDSRQTPDTLDLVKRMHANIMKRALPEDTEIVNYAGRVPRTGALYDMVAIPGGKFLMGSPENEADRNADEGPQVEVTIAPFWIGKCEVTWDEYEPFMITEVDREKHGGRKDYDSLLHTMVDAVSQPTKPYVEMSFGMGQRGYPAISMTHHAANKYCQWLSAQTGHFYRLPTEAEWEYACRAGTTTAYSFGDDASKIGDYAWYYENSNEKYQKVGQKKPNDWGLHDMHGNVMEWVADRYEPKYFELIKNKNTDPLLKPDGLYPRSVRGGGWDDDAEQLRSAARRGSTAAWKQQDPQLPKSIWYHTDARWLGFRIVRPLKTPSAEEMHFYWNSAANKR